MLVNNNNGNSRDPEIVEDPENLMTFEDRECFEDPGPNNHHLQCIVINHYFDVSSLKT